MRILIRKPELACICEKLNLRSGKSSLNIVLFFFCIVFMLGSGVLACIEVAALPWEHPARLSRIEGELESAELFRSRYAGGVRLVLKLSSGASEVFRIQQDALPISPEELMTGLDRQTGQRLELLYYRTALNSPQIRELRCGETIWFSAGESCALARAAIYGQLTRSGIIWLLCLFLGIPCALGILRFQAKSGKIYPDDVVVDRTRLHL